MNTVNTLFVIISSMLVLLMTPALAMFYSGLVHSKNTLNTIMNCFIVFGVITLQWLVLGYTLAFGDGNSPFYGGFDQLFWNNLSGFDGNGLPMPLFATFQMMFALIAAAIITGSLVGRIKLGVLVVFLIFWSTFVYDILAHMIWGEDGWLLTRGSLDFAGGGVVHISSGVAGLVGALLVGPRKGATTHGGAHSIPYAFVGAVLLFIGWLGFNSGSAYAVDGIAVNAFIVTTFSAATGFLVWILAEWIKHKKPSVLGGLSGLVAGLVGSTPACGYVGYGAAVAIGAVSALACYIGLFLIKEKLRWDDSLDAFAFHGIGGIWGGIATGLFASSAVNPAVAESAGEGLLIGGKFDLLLEQLLAIVVCVVISAIVSFLIFKIISLFTSLRVDEKLEEVGLDKVLHGEEAYNME